MLETGRNWTFVSNMVEGYFDEAKLAHSLKRKVVASARIKTNKIDANTLAHLLSSELIQKPIFFQMKQGQ